MDTILTQFFSSPPIKKDEILRYAGIKENIPDMDALVDECILECENIFTYKVCYGIFPVSFDDGFVDLSFMKINSKALLENLSGSKEAVVFAATTGLSLDRHISKYMRISPSKALMLQAIGTERIESLCDSFCEYIKCSYGFTTPRFSPGYGDFPIEFQKDIFRILSPETKIGLTLNHSMLMSPSKSVTAVMGLTDKEETKKQNCSRCQKADCLYRRKL